LVFGSFFKGTFRSPSKGNFLSSRLFGNQTVTAKLKTNPQVGFHERAQRAKESCSLALTLSAHSAGMRIVTYGPASAENQILVDFPLRETGKSKGDSASCGMRLRALP